MCGCLCLTSEHSPPPASFFPMCAILLPFLFALRETSWDKTDASAFCGCVAGAGMGKRDQTCGDVNVPTAAVEKEDKLGEDTDGEVSNGNEDKNSKAKVSARPLFPQDKRDIRNCQACAAAWPVLEKGTKLGSNMEKSAFFATRTGSQSDPKRSKKLFDEVRKACMANPVEGESSRRHSRQCMTTAKQLTRSSILSQWCVSLVFC